MVLKLKITFNGDVRRLRAVPRDFASLCVEAFKTHEIPLQDRTNLVLKYIDDEGDFITLSSTRDFEEALALAREERRKSLKLFVFDKAAVAAEHLAATRINGAASFMSESVATASVFGGRPLGGGGLGSLGVASVVSPASESSFPPLAPPAATETVTAKAAPEEVETATEEPAKPQAAEKDETKKDENEKPAHQRCGGMRQKLIDFIRNPKVQADLPDAVLVWFATLREELNAAAANPTANANEGAGTANAAKGAIIKAFDTVLETFESLGSNELVKKARRHVERLAEKAAPFVPFVVSLDENQVVVHVRKILEMVNARLNGEDGGDFSPDALRGMLPPGIGAFLPMAGAFFGGGGGFPGAAGAEGASPFGGGSFFDLFGAGMNQNEDDDEEDDDDEDDEEEDATPKEDPAPETDANGNVIHYGVECDGCKVAPIVGARFKCYTCPDFDLCAKCEKTMDPLQFFGTGHKIEHMMTKYRKPREGAGERAAHAHARGSRRFGGGGRCGGRNRFGGRRHHHGHGFGGGRHHHGFGGGRHHGHGFGGRRGGWWRGGNQQEAQQQGMPDFSQMGPFGAMLGNMMGGAAAGQQGAAAGNPFAAMFGGANPAGTAGAGATPFDPRAFEQMMGGMFGGGANGGRCGGFGGRHGGRWAGRRGKKGQRGPYNAEIVIAEDAAGAEPSGCRRRRETKKVTLDDASYTFTIKNTGEAEWPAGTRVVYTRHDRIGEMEIDLPVAKPGESVDVTIPLSVDELTVGERYHSVYRLKLPIDTHRPPRKFGDPLHVRVEVVATAAAADAEAAKTEVAKPRKASALSPPEGVDEEEETKDYEPPQAKKDEPVAKGKLEPLAAAPAAATKPAAEEAAAAPTSEYAEKLELLAGMGFPQESLNEWCLRENDGNVQKAALQLVQLYNSKE